MRLPQSGRFPGRTRRRSPGVSPAVFLAHPPDLQPWPLMDMDFATSCPLVRPALPRIRFLFVGSRLCSTLPSDSPSRFRPCALLVLHLHQVAQGTFTPKLSDMSDTQDAARRLRRCRRVRGGILDCRCARRSAGRQVGTKGWSFSDRTKGCCSIDLNEPPHPNHDQFAELDAHNYLPTPRVNDHPQTF